MRSALIALAALIPTFASAADDPIQWGQPVNGLRIGVQSAVTSISSAERPKFKVVAENVSAQPISIPSPDSFVPAKNPGREDYHVTALTSVIKQTLPKPPEVPGMNPLSLRRWGGSEFRSTTGQASGSRTLPYDSLP